MTQRQFLTTANEANEYAIVILDAKGRVTTWNKGAHMQTGYEADEILGQPFPQIYPSEDATDGNPAKDLEVAARDGELEADRFCVHKDGSRFWAKVTLTALRDKTGKLLGFIKVLRGIDNRNDARNAPEQSHLLAQSILDSLPTNVVVLDGEGVILAVNEAYREFARDNDADERTTLGVGLSYFSVIDSAYDAGLETVRAVRDGIVGVISGVIPSFKFEYPCDGPDTLRWFVMTVSPIGSRGSGAVISHMDITERKVAEQKIAALNLELEQRIDERTAKLLFTERRYKTMFDSIDQGFCIIEMIFDENEKPVDYRFIEVNRAFENQTGIIDAVGRTMREIAPSHEEHWFGIYGNIALTGEPARFQNVAEQLRRWYDVYAFRFDESKPLQVAILFNDVSKQKELEVSLRRANKELDSFTHSVSHDLRAPLRHIHGFVDLLMKASEGALSDRCLGYLNVIQSASYEMGQLIDDLLAFSRMTKIEICERPISLNSLAQDLLRAFKSETQGRDIVWRIGDLPLVIGDPSLIRQVLTNLLNNAVKYTSKRDHPEIEIGVFGNEEDRVVVFVRDNGAGFDMQYASKLFGVFQRLHRADEFEGTGIGLAIVNSIVTRHGGRTWAEGAVDQGATFYFTLKPASEPSKSGTQP